MEKGMTTMALATEKFYKRLGERIRELRAAKAVSQEELAKELGTTANTVSRWEAAIYRPSPENLYRLADFFGIPIAAFFPGSEQAPKADALLSAVRGLDEDDLEEVILYALFRRARQAKPRK